MFLDHGHPCFRDFYFTVPIDVVKVKSYANRLLNPACVAMKIKINKLYFFPKRVVFGVVGVF